MCQNPKIIIWSLLSPKGKDMKKTCINHSILLGTLRHGKRYTNHHVHTKQHISLLFKLIHSNLKLHLTSLSTKKKKKKKRVKCTFNSYILYFFYFGLYILFLRFLVPKLINTWNLDSFCHPTNSKSWRDWRWNKNIYIITKKIMPRQHINLKN